MVLQRVGQPGRHGDSRLGDDESLGLDQILIVGHADHRGFEHIGMRHQRRFDFERRHVHAADFQHVVRAPTKGVITLRIPGELVASARPRPDEGRQCLRAIAPIVGRAGRTVDLQFADLASGDVVVMFVHETDPVTRYGLAGAAVANPARAVGNENVQHLGRTDAVEDFHAELFRPAAAQVRR